jgi:hypothetical protein
MVCWNGIIALVIGMILGAAAVYEFPNNAGSPITAGLAIAAAVLIVLSVYWFSRPPCEEPGETT